MRHINITHVATPNKYDVGDLYESVFFVCLLISLLKRLHSVNKDIYDACWRC